MISTPHTRPWMQTRGGRRFYFDDPREGVITIRDIAAGLSKLCRFNGQSSEFFSVAEHSVNVSRVVEARGHGHLALAALLHDASEAYLGDVSKPLKSCADMEGYRKREAVTQERVEKTFRLPRGSTSDAAIKAADLDCLASEALRLMVPLDPGWEVWLAGANVSDVPPVLCLSWRAAETVFLDRFEALRKPGGA